MIAPKPVCFRNLAPVWEHRIWSNLHVRLLFLIEPVSKLPRKLVPVKVRFTIAGGKHRQLLEIQVPKFVEIVSFRLSMSHRITQLQQYVNEDPADPFNLYALALEYQKTDEGKALDIFNRLCQEHAEYIPTYYQLGKLHQASGKNEMALQVFERGIEMARKQNDLKALRELQAAKQELLFEDQ